MLDASLLDGSDVGDRAETKFRTPRIRLYLVGGCHPPTDSQAWLFATPDGVAVSDVQAAQLFTFSMAGYRAARAAASKLTRGMLSGYKILTARVVVTGERPNPEEVIEAWRLEGDRPVRVGRYSFEE